MREERASRTATMVAFVRAFADVGGTQVPGFRDPIARQFLSEKATRRLDALIARMRAGKTSARMRIAHVSATMMALRTEVIDAAVRTAVRDGVRQVVILGAGLDGRAWRLPELRGTRVIEIDHPATQRFKRSRLDRLPPPIAEVELVPVNFERDSLDGALARAGHDATRPTCWIWEGVVMYLAPETMRATLREIASRSAPGSVLIVNYHTSKRSLIVRLVFRLLGEPVRSAFQPAEMAAVLGEAGFTVVEDSGGAEWLERHGLESIPKGPVAMMRIAVARRREGSLPSARR